MVLAVANYLKVSDNEEIKKISTSLTPVLLNSVTQVGNLKLFT